IRLAIASNRQAVRRISSRLHAPRNGHRFTRSPGWPKRYHGAGKGRRVTNGRAAASGGDVVKLNGVGLPALTRPRRQHLPVTPTAGIHGGYVASPSTHLADLS